MNEYDLYAKIKKRLPDIFGAASIWDKTSPGPWTASGRPDLVGCCHGAYVAIELKHPRYGSKPWTGLTEEQSIRLEQIKNAGGIACVVNEEPWKDEDGWYLWAYVKKGDEWTRIILNEFYALDWL